MPYPGFPPRGGDAFSALPQITAAAAARFNHIPICFQSRTFKLVRGKKGNPFPQFGGKRPCRRRSETMVRLSCELGTIYRAFRYNEDNHPSGNNAGNDLVEETDSRGNKTSYTVNSSNSRRESVTDRVGTKTDYEYDSAGRTTAVTCTQADGTALSTVSYTYDGMDNLTAITRGDGMKYALAYNAFHQLSDIGIDGKNEKLIRYTYKNGNGRLKQISYANGHTMKATYNSLGQMISEKWYASASAAEAGASPIAAYRYVYDGKGNIVRSLDKICKKEYTYEYEDDRVIRATESDVTLSGETVTARSLVSTLRYYYDAEGKMTKKVISPAGGRTVTSRSGTDSFGRKAFDELQLGTTFAFRQFVYHEGQITPEHKTHEKVKSIPTTQLVSRIILSNGTTVSYDYDAEERITSVTESYTVAGTSVTNTTLYTYDALGQLLTETVNGEVVNSMEYDNYGNITQKNGKTYTYGNTVWKDLLTKVGTGENADIVYDAQGNPTHYLGHTLTWEKGRQLKSFDSNTYNANGIRTSKTVRRFKMYIALQHTYFVDIIYVPAVLGEKIKKIQNLFDKWLYDKNNDHGHWIIKNGKKVAVSFDTDTFIQYINTYHLVDNNEKAYLVDKERQTIPDTCDATLFF